MAVKRCLCPTITNEDWEGKELDWENKTFYFHFIKHFMHKPINLEEKSRQLKKEVVTKSYEFIDQHLIICEWAQFKGRLMTQIKNPEIYDANIHLFDLGKIYTTVFRGKPKELNLFVNDFKSQIELNHGIPVQNIFIWYAHCKNCAKDKDNVSVIFAKA